MSKLTVFLSDFGFRLLRLGTFASLCKSLRSVNTYCATVIIWYIHCESDLFILPTFLWTGGADSEILMVLSLVQIEYH